MNLVSLNLDGFLFNFKFKTTLFVTQCEWLILFQNEAKISHHGYYGTKTSQQNNTLSNLTSKVQKEDGHAQRHIEF